MFQETQKFKQPWIWMLIGISGLLVLTIFGTGIYKQILMGQKFGNHPMSDAGLVITFGLVLLLYMLLFALFGFATLKTIIDKKGIAYQFFPFHITCHFIAWNMIEHYELITYHPIRDYGGWGIRFGKGGKAYNVSGDKGLQLHLKNGKKILIGTQKEKEMFEFLSGLIR